MTINELTVKQLIINIDAMRDLRSTWQFAKEKKIVIATAKYQRMLHRQVAYKCAICYVNDSCAPCPWYIISNHHCNDGIRYYDIKPITRIKQLTSWIQQYQEELAKRS